jgi:hypothetical protein
MTGNKKGVRPLSHYDRQMLNIIDKYIDETGTTDVDHTAVVTWAMSKGHIDIPEADVVRNLVRAMSRASRSEYLRNENGEPVRRRHSYRINQGEQQLTLWVKMEDIVPEKMRLSIQQRRKGIAADVAQADRDVKFYNKNHNPGDPIEPDWDFNKDLAERAQSSEYDDSPPESDD